MSISDKTRKVLWARSGNLCAICKRALVVNKTDTDKDSVVGQECHIISGKQEGPRYDPSIPAELFDDVSNLILLCAADHKMVDDQNEKYSSAVLGKLKAEYERWVADRLRDEQYIPSLRVRRFKNQIPEHLTRVVSGHDFFNVSTPCSGMYPYYSSDLDDEEIELVGGFIQNIKDWNDLYDDLEPIQQMRAAKEITDEIANLHDNGFLVFAAIEKQRIEGGKSMPSDWHMLHLSVVRQKDPNIVGMTKDPSLDEEVPF